MGLQKGPGRGAFSCKWGTPARSGREENNSKVYKRFWSEDVSCQGQNLGLAVLHVPLSLERGFALEGTRRLPPSALPGQLARCPGFEPESQDQVLVLNVLNVPVRSTFDIFSGR